VSESEYGINSQWYKDICAERDAKHNAEVEAWYEAQKARDARWVEMTPDKYKSVVRVLLEWQGALSDGYKDYLFCGCEDNSKCDCVQEALVEIAKEIYGDD